MKRAFLSLFACTALVSGAQAYTATFDLEANLLRSTAATTALPTTGLCLLVASTTNTSFGATIAGGTNLAVGSILSDGDDQILARFDLSASTTGGVLLVNPSISTGGMFANLAGGAPLALYWFPTLTLSSTVVPNATTSYGTYQTGNTLPLNGSAAWTFPAATTNNQKLYFITTDANTTFNAAGSHTPAEATAALFTTPVPEPSSLAFAVLASTGLGWLVLRRRNRFA